MDVRGAPRRAGRGMPPLSPRSRPLSLCQQCNTLYPAVDPQAVLLRSDTGSLPTSRRSSLARAATSARCSQRSAASALLKDLLRSAIPGPGTGNLRTPRPVRTARQRQCRFCPGDAAPQHRGVCVQRLQDGGAAPAGAGAIYALNRPRRRQANGRTRAFAP